MVAANFSMNFFTITDINDHRFNQCLMIYRNSFPGNERQPEDVIIDRIHSGKAKLYVGEDGGDILCIALVWIFHDSRFALLDYFAVAASMRGKGVGSIFLKFLLQEVIGIGRSLVMEVEHPGHGVNIDERKARINFYRRNGAVVLEDVRYLLPPLGAATEPMEMQLMIAFAHGPATSAAEIRDLITRIYTEVYIRGPDDQLLNSFVR